MTKLLALIFTKDEQKFLLAFFGFLILGSLLQLMGYEGKKERMQPVIDSLLVVLSEDVSMEIDIRTATLKELKYLPAIGTKRAMDIIAYRDSIGFQNVNEICNVKGIGEKIYQRILPDLLVFGNSEYQKKKTTVKSTKTKSTKPQQIYTGKVNINSAGVKELSRLSGIGPVKAKAIIDYREEHGAFKTAEELTKVKGIGAKTLEKNLDRIVLE